MAYRGDELIFSEYDIKNNCCNYVCSVIFFVKIYCFLGMGLYKVNLHVSYK